MFPPKQSQPHRGGDSAAERVIVAVKADKAISNSALTWAITHATRPGDSITLLAIVSHHRTTTGGSRFWGFLRLKGNRYRSSELTKLPDRVSEILDTCAQMVLQLQDQIQVRVRIKVVSAICAGTVRAEAKSKSASWVILDKKLKGELKHCVDELHCNIVVMKGSHPKVVRLNLTSSNDLQTPFYSAYSSLIKDTAKVHSHNMKHTTPVCSPEDPSTSYTVENSMSSPDTGASIFILYEQNPLYEGLGKGKHPPSTQSMYDRLRKGAVNVSATPSKTCRNQGIFSIDQNPSVNEEVPRTAFTYARTKLANSPQYNEDIISRGREIDRNHGGDYGFNSSIREAVYLVKTSSNPPPLCSLCHLKAPAFGNPPKQFDYTELEEATDRFSDQNFVAESVFGLVHRGVLQNGLIVAVKQLKLVGPQREADFCREVRVLSCAQHRNVVLLIGFCIEGNRKLLVYEYICNSSLDFHLHGNGKSILDWHTRLKIAIGTARGLRYLHEDCRVGCIIHRKLRPNNILLTHDFEPLVADFGLARLHSEWELCDKDQVVGTSGYLAPEYFNDGQMTEKVDIYAFGLVLLELITGQRAHDLQYSMEHQVLLDNIHALSSMEPIHILASKHQLMDPRLSSSCKPHALPYELHALGYAASLCLQQDPNLRPPMSKVVKLLEGTTPATPLALELGSVGCRSGHMQGPNSNAVLEPERRHYRRLSY